MNHKQATALVDALRCYTGLDSDSYGKTPGPEQKAKAFAKVRAWQEQLIEKPRKEYEKLAKIKATAVMTDLPDMITNSFTVFPETSYYDQEWSRAVREVPTDASRDFFEIATVTNGIAFRKYGEGGRIVLDGISGDKVQVQIEKYGGAMQWTWEMVQYRKAELIADRAEFFVASYYFDLAERYYALLAAAGAASAVIPYQTNSAGRQFADIDTMSFAANTLLESVKDSYMGITPNEPLLLYLPPKAKGRIEQAQKLLVNNVAGSATLFNWNVTPVYTYNGQLPQVADTDEMFRGLLVLPGRKIQRSQRLVPTTYREFDPQSLSYIDAVWYAEGGAVANTDQVRIVQFLV